MKCRKSRENKFLFVHWIIKIGTREPQPSEMCKKKKKNRFHTFTSPITNTTKIIVNEFFGVADRDRAGAERR